MKMKKIVSSICLLLAVMTVQAQTIHWLTFIDTTDENVGKVDVTGRQVLYSNFINEVNAALAPKGYSTDIMDFYGNKVTPENCKAAVQQLRISNPNDIIVFYYIGHGGRPNTDEAYMKAHPYPQMCMAQWNESKFIPLEWVYKELSSKNARLCVTIGMCCNSISNMSIKDGPKFTPNYGSSYMSGNKLARIQELFLGAKGNVLATSASPTQTSGCFSTDFGVVDCYTTVLCSIFKNSLDELNGPLTWNELLEAISSIIDKNTNGEQTPIHNLNLIDAPVPRPSTPSVPTKEQVEETKKQQTQNTTIEQGDDSDWVNELTNMFGVLINTELSEDKRIEIEQVLNTLFVDNAQVRVLAQDSNTIIDREDADVFLGRLATSRLLLRVSVVEGSFDSNGKIKSLKVREVYRK